MAVAGSAGSRALEDVIDAYDRQIDGALHNGLQRRREDRASENAAEQILLTETLIAVRSAQALETLTGIGWEQHLDGRAAAVAKLDESGPSQSN